MRLVIDNSRRFPALKERRVNLDAPPFTLIRNAVMMSLRDGSTHTPVGNGRLADATAKRLHFTGAPKRVNQIGNIRDHVGNRSPNQMDMSTDITAGPTIQQFGRIIAGMRQAVLDLTSIAGRVIALRHSRDMKPVDAYKACGINKTTWCNYENGDSRPSLDNGAAICEVFGVTLDWLYTGNTAGLPSQKLEELYRRQA